MNTTPSSRAVTAVLLAGIGLAAGCAGSHKGSPGRSPIGSKSAATLDGEFGDWREGTAAMADADWLYFHVAVDDASTPLQASGETLSLWLDADGDSKTGARMATPAPAAALGVDAVVEYSPADGAHPGATKRGVAVYAPDPGGGQTPLNHSQIGLASLPTYASAGYELRISRHPDAAAAPALAKALASAGTARVMFVLKDGSGKVLGWSEPEAFTKPSASASAARTDMVIPAKAPGTIRVVSYNVLKSKLASEPNSFARLFQVLDPDIILFQEWNADAATATAWFTAVVTGAHPWNARAAAGDVVIVSPHPIDPLGPDLVMLESESGGGEKAAEIRFVAGLVRAPAGTVAVASMHLKCCGTAGSVEDKTRSAQAAAINNTMRAAIGQFNTRLRVLGGDLNLVGSRAPIEALRAGLNADGSALAIAEPLRTGDAAAFTWCDPQTEFSPGRLDYLLYSDTTAEVVQAFVVDTSNFSTKALARMGLDAGDTGASDHQPVVVDIRPK